MGQKAFIPYFPIETDFSVIESIYVWLLQMQRNAAIEMQAVTLLDPSLHGCLALSYGAVTEIVTRGVWPAHYISVSIASPHHIMVS